MRFCYEDFLMSVLITMAGKQGGYTEYLWHQPADSTYIIHYFVV